MPLGPGSIAEKLQILQEVAAAVSAGTVDEAQAIIRTRYKLGTLHQTDLRAVGAPKKEGRPSGTVSKSLQIQVFRRDGFVDRYSGYRLIYPGALVLLSELFPVDFPYHRNWRRGFIHSSYWDFHPTIDHVDPMGGDGLDNLVSTTQGNNSAKGNRTAAEVGWSLKPPGNLKDWDGMISWFLGCMERNPLSQNSLLGGWHSAALSVGVRGIPSELEGSDAWEEIEQL